MISQKDKMMNSEEREGQRRAMEIVKTAVENVESLGRAVAYKVFMRLGDRTDAMSPAAALSVYVCQEDLIYLVNAALKSPNISLMPFFETWRYRMLSKGWKFGVTWDNVEKTHPHLVPFNNLSGLVKGTYSLILNLTLGEFYPWSMSRSVGAVFLRTCPCPAADAAAKRIYEKLRSHVGGFYGSWEYTTEDERQALMEDLLFLVDAVWSNLGITLRDLAHQWSDMKYSLNWTVGTSYLLRTKKHPCLLPFDDLSVGVRKEYQLIRDLALDEFQFASPNSAPAKSKKNKDFVPPGDFTSKKKARLWLLGLLQETIAKEPHVAMADNNGKSLLVQRGNAFFEVSVRAVLGNPS